MKPKWQKLASLAQEICKLYSFSSLVQSSLPKDILLKTYFLHLVVRQGESVGCLPEKGFLSFFYTEKGTP